MVLYTYTIKHNPIKEEAYDEAMITACLQGIANEEKPSVYVLTDKSADRDLKGINANERWLAEPDFWLDIMTSDDRWLSDYDLIHLDSLDDLFNIVKNKVEGVVIWDSKVPATFNVANTLAGLKNYIVMSEDIAPKYLDRWNLKIVKDFRGMFDGSVTGSAKNDAYRWAIKEYLEPGLCSSKFIFLYEDPFMARAKGDVGYVVTRDWAIKNKGFVYDLSPWGDEVPADDLSQPIGCDRATYQILLETLYSSHDPNKFTELCGFFCFSKYSNMPDHASSHEPVDTEWETVYIISPYNCYQNTVASVCYNQSVHSQCRIGDLKQSRPKEMIEIDNNKTYIAILMADYDSATPLYAFMPKHWTDKTRGSIPLLWGVNPNLSETYPDVIEYMYSTRSENDYFAGDASCAGYFNPTKIPEANLPAFAAHNKYFYDKFDMTMSPMVLDWDKPTDEIKDAFLEFSPDGFATIVMDLHHAGGEHPEDHNWKGMPVTTLINDACDFYSVEATAKTLSNRIKPNKNGEPGHYFFRIVWTDPKDVIASINLLKEMRPELDIEVVDAYNFFNICKTLFKNK